MSRHSVMVPSAMSRTVVAAIPTQTPGRKPPLTDSPRGRLVVGLRSERAGSQIGQFAAMPLSRAQRGRPAFLPLTVEACEEITNDAIDLMQEMVPFLRGKVEPMVVGRNEPRDAVPQRHEIRVEEPRLVRIERQLLPPDDRMQFADESFGILAGRPGEGHARWHMLTVERLLNWPVCVHECSEEAGIEPSSDGFDLAPSPAVLTEPQGRKHLREGGLVPLDREVELENAVRGNQGRRVVCVRAISS
jgi:hypothetical protein